jgi:hypothetical protein
VAKPAADHVEVRASVFPTPAFDDVPFIAGVGLETAVQDVDQAVAELAWGRCRVEPCLTSTCATRRRCPYGPGPSGASCPYSLLPVLGGSGWYPIKLAPGVRRASTTVSANGS